MACDNWRHCRPTQGSKRAFDVLEKQYQVKGIRGTLFEFGVQMLVAVANRLALSKANRLPR